MKTATNYQASELKETRTMAQLKKEAKERGIVPTGDKRYKATWVNALTSASTSTFTSISSEVKKLQPKSISTSMAVSHLESVFSDAPHYLDFNQLKRLAKEKGIAIKGKTKQAYISQIKAALAN
jgi:hypothetical protein